jgi:hypothetical protein
MPPEDFPAAHSMDSTWFAVDKDGFVAYFSTGESGAMPAVGYTGEDAFELERVLIRDLPAGDVLHDPRGRSLPGDPLRPFDAANYPTIVFLTSLAPVQSDIEAKRATAVRASEGYAVVFPRLSADQVRRLTESGVVRGSDFHFDRESEGGRQPLARYGLYEYDHLCENWVAGPYGRHRAPGRPVHVDQLPPVMRTRLKQARLSDLRFADTVYLQPAEHWECESWEPAWLGLDQVVRPFPGRGDDYQEVYDMRDDFPGVRFEPPPDDE